MRGAISPLQPTPSWRGAELSTGTAVGDTELRRVRDLALVAVRTAHERSCSLFSQIARVISFVRLNGRSHVLSDTFKAI
jgi:hypothetical protein